jgi:flagellar protein FlbD
MTMIVLHRLGHSAEPFYLSPDLIVTVEATPDTVLTLTTGAKIVVNEPPEAVAQRVRKARVAVLVDAARVRDDERAANESEPSLRRVGSDSLRAIDAAPRAFELR